MITKVYTTIGLILPFTIMDNCETLHNLIRGRGKRLPQPLYTWRINANGCTPHMQISVVNISNIMQIAIKSLMRYLWFITFVTFTNLTWVKVQFHADSSDKKQDLHIVKCSVNIWLWRLIWRWVYWGLRSYPHFYKYRHEVTFNVTSAGTYNQCTKAPLEATSILSKMTRISLFQKSCHFQYLKTLKCIFGYLLNCCWL